MLNLQRVIFVSIWSSLVLAKGVVADDCCECIRKCNETRAATDPDCLANCKCNNDEDPQCTFGPNIDVTSVPTATPAPSDAPSVSVSSVPTASPAPSDAPSVSAAPTTTSAPTIACTCCDCTATSGCVLDPHYYTWSAPWYDFQGSCDQKAITNNILELQIQTRGTGYGFSTVSQLALHMKGTDEVFQIHMNGTVQNGITSASGATYSVSTSGYVHTVTFETPTDKVSFIKVTSSANRGMSVCTRSRMDFFRL